MISASLKIWKSKRYLHDFPDLLVCYMWLIFSRERCRLNTNQPQPLPPPSAFISQATDGDFQEQDSVGSNELKEKDNFGANSPPPFFKNQVSRMFKSPAWELDRFEFVSRSYRFLTLWSLTSYLNFSSLCFYICKTWMLIVPLLFPHMVRRKWVGLPSWGLACGKWKE